MRYTNQHNLPAALLAALTSQNYDPRKSQWNVIGLTALIDSPKVRMLKIRHWDDAQADAIDSVARFIGSSVHDKINSVSRTAKTEVLSEERIYINCETWEVHTVTPNTSVKDQPWYTTTAWFISMQFDSYAMVDDTHGDLEDYKVTSAWTMVYDPNGKAGWEEQLNVEAYVLRKLGFPVTTIRDNLMFKDWSASQAEKSGSYPRIPYAAIEHEIWEDSEVEDYIRTRLAAHTPAVDFKDDEIPACTEEERWAKKAVFAVMKAGRTTAVKLHDTKANAQTHAEELIKKDGPVYSVVERPGEDVRCTGYCEFAAYCSYAKQKYGK